MDGTRQGARPVPVKRYRPSRGVAFFDSSAIGLTSRRVGSIIPS
jgi:hypothetical protein